MHFKTFWRYHFLKIIRSKLIVCIAYSGSFQFFTKHLLYNRTHRCKLSATKVCQSVLLKQRIATTSYSTASRNFAANHMIEQITQNLKCSSHIIWKLYKKDFIHTCWIHFILSPILSKYTGGFCHFVFSIKVNFCLLQNQLF